MIARIKALLLSIIAMFEDHTGSLPPPENRMEARMRRSVARRKYRKMTAAE